MAECIVGEEREKNPLGLFVVAVPLSISKLPYFPFSSPTPTPNLPFPEPNKSTQSVIFRLSLSLSVYLGKAN